MPTTFADKIEMQHRLFAELSRMFGSEVPLYDKSLLVNRLCNRAVCDLLARLHVGFSISDEELDRTSGERHGAIRIGRPDEYRWISRFFAAFAMQPHNYYDMSNVGAKSQPIIATAFRSAHDGLPEPLCAIYEPRSNDALERYAAAGRNCPRKFLIESAATLVDLPDARALDNINSATEYWQTMQTLAPRPDGQEVQIQYFALLREQAGRSRETLRTQARTPRELYAELRTRHPFTLDVDLLRVAVNGEFGDWEQPLAEGDAVVFIPPVAGG